MTTKRMAKKSGDKEPLGAKWRGECRRFNDQVAPELDKFLHAHPEFGMIARKRMYSTAQKIFGIPRNQCDISRKEHTKAYGDLTNVLLIEPAGENRARREKRMSTLTQADLCGHNAYDPDDSDNDEDAVDEPFESWAVQIVGDEAATASIYGAIKEAFNIYKWRMRRANDLKKLDEFISNQFQAETPLVGDHIFFEHRTAFERHLIHRRCGRATKWEGVELTHESFGDEDEEGQKQMMITFERRHVVLRCSGFSKAGLPCKIVSTCGYPNADPLLYGSKLCCRHGENVQCRAFAYSTGRRCQINSKQLNNQAAAPLRHGEHYCQCHAGQAGGAGPSGVTPAPSLFAMFDGDGFDERELVTMQMC